MGDGRLLSVHSQLIWQGPICADVQDMDHALSGYDLAETTCDDYNSVVEHRSRQPVFSLSTV